jgi:hypothetical protein
MGKVDQTKERLISGLMETKFAEDSLQYYDRNIDWLESLTVEELKYMQEEWDVLGDN